MKSIITLICTIAATSTFAFGFGFGNGRCNNSYNNAGVSNSNYITVIDTLRSRNGQTIVQLCEISGREYIIARAGLNNGGSNSTSNSNNPVMDLINVLMVKEAKNLNK